MGSGVRIGDLGENSSEYVKRSFFLQLQNVGEKIKRVEDDVDIVMVELLMVKLVAGWCVGFLLCRSEEICELVYRSRFLSETGKIKDCGDLYDGTNVNDTNANNMMAQMRSQQHRGGAVSVVSFKKRRVLLLANSSGWVNEIKTNNKVSKHINRNGQAEELLHKRP